MYYGLACSAPQDIIPGFAVWSTVPAERLSRRPLPKRARRNGAVVSPTDLVRGVFAALDAKDPAAVTAQMTDDVRMRLGNAELVEGKAEFRKATTSFVASIAAIRHEITSMWSYATRPGVRFAYVKDPEGNLIELTGPLKASQRQEHT